MDPESEREVKLIMITIVTIHLLAAPVAYTDRYASLKLEGFQYYKAVICNHIGKSKSNRPNSIIDIRVDICVDTETK